MTHPYTKILNSLAEIDPAEVAQVLREMYTAVFAASINDDYSFFSRDIAALRELGPVAETIADRWERLAKNPHDGYPDAQARSVPSDFYSHKMAWRAAIVQCGLSAAASESDRAYWEHELRAFDRAYAELGPPAP